MDAAADFMPRDRPTSPFVRSMGKRKEIVDILKAAAARLALKKFAPANFLDENVQDFHESLQDSLELSWTRRGCVAAADTKKT